MANACHSNVGAFYVRIHIFGVARVTADLAYNMFFLFSHFFSPRF